MSFEKIKQNLENLVLGPEIFTPTGEIVELIHSVLSVPTLEVRNAVISEESDAKLVIDGKISVFGVDDIHASIEMEENEDDDPAFKMTFTMPENWSLREGIPLLARFAAGSPLEELNFKTATLTLSNTDSETDNENGDEELDGGEIIGENTPEVDDDSEKEKIVAGLNLETTIGLSGRFKDAAALADADGPSLTLKGWLKPAKAPEAEEENAGGEGTNSSAESFANDGEPAKGPGEESAKDEYYPLFDFTIELNEANLEYSPFILNDMGLGLKNELLITEEDASEDGDKVRMEFFATLNGKVTLGSVEVDATALIPTDPEKPLEFTFAFKGLIANLVDVIFLLGDDDSQVLLPENSQNVGALEVISFAIHILPEEKRPTLVSLEIGNANPWVLLENVLTIDQVRAEWLVTDPTRPRTRQVYAYLFGSIEINDEEENKVAHLQASAEFPDRNVAAWLMEGDKIRVIALFSKLIPEISHPGGMEDLAITALDLKANPLIETFHFSGQLGDVWSVETGLGAFAIKTLFLSLDMNGEEHNVQFGGTFILANAEFDLLLDHSDNDWTFSAGLAPGSEVNISSLIHKVFGYDLGESFGLRNISITRLELHFEKGDNTSSYQFAGEAGWALELSGLDKEIEFLAGLEIAREAGKQAAGKIYGSVGTEIEGLEYLKLTLAYEFEKENDALSAEMALGNFITLRATLEESTEKTTITFDTIASEDADVKTIVLTLGDMLTFMARLIDPAIEEFALDQPWDALNSLEIYKGSPANTLSGITVKIEFSQNEKTITVSYDINKFIIPKVLKVISIGMVYQPPEDKKSSGFNISLLWEYLGEQQPERTWDALNDPAPTVPRKSAFELEYLGLGQHVALVNFDQFKTVEGVIGALSSAVIEGESGKLIVFNRDSDWLIGAKFSLIDLLDMSIIFNDPVLYGMVIQLGDKAKPFNGLKFEILYRRISDTIGVYHTELTLPDDFRHFNVGAVNVTLPVVVVDIYTNGDFAVDIGFPWNGDWSRAALAEASIFTGSGGFYFAKLSGATATGLPDTKGNGEFGLVLKFGLGLRLGVGRSFQRGPLKAELSLTIQGIFEGLLAWYHYPPALRREPEMYYHMQASVQLVGRLYGAVDFEVIKIEVEVIVYAGIQMSIDTYVPMLVVLVAGVSVRASITILFIEVDFTFDMTIRESFTLGERSTPPWEQPSFAVPAAFALSEAAVFAPSVWAWDTHYKVWGKNEEGEEVKQPLDILFQLAFTEGLASDRLDGPGEETSEVKGVALLFIENDSKRADGQDFNQLTRALFKWAIKNYQDYEPSSTSITREHLKELHRMLDTGENNTFSFDELMEFLAANFTFSLKLADEKTETVSATIFPMFPQLTLTSIGNDGQPVLVNADFAKKNQKSAAELKDLLTHFDELKVFLLDYSDEQQTDTGLASAAEEEPATVSMAAVIYVDYFAMLTRSVVQTAIDFLPDEAGSAISEPLDDFIDSLIEAKKYSQLASMISRFMLYGLRLPFSPPLGLETKTYPLYELTGQQFTIPDETVLDQLGFTLEATAAELPAWLSFAADQSSLTKKLHKNQIDLIDNGFEKLTFSPTINAQEQLPLYDWAPVRFDFSQPLTYQDGEATKAIWPFPSNLVRQLTSLASDVGLEFGVYNGKIDTSDDGDEHQKTLAQKPLSPEPNWGTLIEFTVGRVPASDGTSFLKDVYLVTGIGGRQANSSGEDYLEELIDKTGSDTTLSLLFEDSDNKTLKLANPEFLLLKTNLAGGSGANTGFGAAHSEATDFARLLWQAGKTEGGTFLRVAGLPEATFGSTDSAVLSLLALETDLGGQPISKVHRRHNCLVTGEQVKPNEVVLYAQSKDQIKMLTVPPGHVGFRITRKPIRLDPDNKRWDDELDNLFQLLTYRLRATESFTDSIWGKPVGPTVDPVSPEDPDDDLWIYERVIPAHRYALEKLADKAGLPPVSKNPYAGIGPEAKVEVEFEFQDVYGNRTTRADPEALAGMQIDVGYTDAILGLKTWPGAILTYELETVMDVPGLILRLRLDMTIFSGADMADKVETARSVYWQLYYQVHQEDLTFTLSTSLNPSLEQELEKSRFIGFIEDAYRFFDALYKQADAMAPPLSTVTFEGIPLSRKKEALHPELIFPVTVQIEINRDPSLIHPQFKDVDAIKSSSIVIPPLVTKENAEAAIALRSFAEAFEAAFPGLKLMSGNVDDSFGQPATLWAAQFGPDGIRYTLDAGETALFFAPAPLSNKLITGKVDSKTYTDIDLDIWGREFLAAVDAFLDADLSVPAFEIAKESVENILKTKKSLAEAIALQVRPILTGDPAHGDDLDERRKTAADVLKQQVLTRLENAYTIETIVQLGVEVSLPENREWPGTPPRLSGKPLAVDLSAQPDYTLSTATIQLASGRSTLNFIYNTPVPEADRLARIRLSYHANALEFRINPLKNLPGYEDSSWLTFILPFGKTVVAGEVHIPIPLRVFPMPPSLVMQSAEADMDSLVSLDHIREWQYVYLYEHLDAAQDTIETNIHFNMNPASGTVASQSPGTQNDLFVELAKFREQYPDILSEMTLLKKDASSKDEKAKAAVDLFAQLVGKVAAAWMKIQPPESEKSEAEYYAIQASDADTSEGTREKELNLDYYVNGAKTTASLPIELSSIHAHALNGSAYGVPNIPDFKVSIDNRDIIGQQNAWAEIWLSRNRHFGENTVTHPAFVYRTPKVRFGNMLTPLLVNNTEWHIDGEPASVIERKLGEHIEQLFATILPEDVGMAYDLRISCGYAFALAEGLGDRPDLLVPLPVALGPRFSVRNDSGSEAKMLDVTLPFRQNLEAAIRKWWVEHQPSTAKGMFVFKLSIVSSAGTLPLLQINDLRLNFENISDLVVEKTVTRF